MALRFPNDFSNSSSFNVSIFFSSNNNYLIYQFQTVWKSPFHGYVQIFFDHLSIGVYFDNISEIAYYVVFYFIVLLLILNICNITYVAYSVHRSYLTVTWPLILLRYSLKAMITVLIMPIYGNNYIIKLIKIINLLLKTLFNPLTYSSLILQRF